MSAGTGLDRPFRTMRRLVELRRPVVHAVAPDTTLAAAARLMDDRGIEALVVLDGDTLRGLITTQHVAAAAARHPETAPRDLRVADVMEPVAARAGLDTTVPEALAMLPDQKPAHLAVLDGGRVVDLLSRADLLAELVWHHAEVIREMKLQERLMHLQGVYSC